MDGFPASAELGAPLLPIAGEITTYRMSRRHLDQFGKDAAIVDPASIGSTSSLGRVALKVIPREAVVLAAFFTAHPVVGRLSLIRRNPILRISEAVVGAEHLIATVRRVIDVSSRAGQNRLYARRNAG